MTVQPLSDEEQRGLAFLCGRNERVLEVISQVAARQRQSISQHQRARRCTSGLPSQLPFAAPILPVCVRSAQGSRMVDLDGNEYIDCHMAYTASLLGHNPPAVTEAVQQALDRGLGAGHFFVEQAELAERFQRMVPGLERVAFFHSGGEAVSASVRLVRAATRRTLIAKFEGCYHGWGDIGIYNTMMILSGRLPQGPLDKIEPQPATGGTTAAPGRELLILPYNSPLAFDLIRAHAAELAGVVIDPVPPFMASWVDDARQFLSELRSVTTTLDVPLVFDEVVSGFRLARGGAQGAFSIHADLSCYGKITSGLGIPLTAVGGRAPFLDCARTDGLFADYRAGKAWVSTTNAANFLAVIASLAQLRFLDEHYDSITTRMDRNWAQLDHVLRDFAARSGIPVALRGHPRLQSVITLGDSEPSEKTYRGVMASASPWQIRALLLLTFYLRLRGVYTKTIPSMNLSAAHTEADVAQIADAICQSVLQMREDGALS